MGQSRGSSTSIPSAHGRVIDGLSPDMPGALAIELSLGGRLSAVEELLPLAAVKAEFDARAVHRLRVATRRAAAAIRAFEDSLPKKRRKQTLRILKEIRSAASEARASDVDLAALGEALESAPSDQRLALAMVIGVISSERAAAAASLAEHCAGDVAERLRKAATRLRKSAGDSNASGADLLTLAKTAVQSQFEEAVGASLADLHIIDHLHQLRIECKRLRYTLEAVGPCTAELGLTSLYDVLVESQDQFGAVNDAHELSDRIDRIYARYTQSPFELSPRMVESLDILRDAQRKRAAESHDAFLLWWDSSSLQRALSNRGPLARSPLDEHRVHATPNGRRTPEETSS